MGFFLLVFKRGKHGGKCLWSLLRGGGDRQMCGVWWPANLAILVTFRPVRNLSHNIRWMAFEECHTGDHLQSHTDIWTSTLSHKSNLKGTVFHKNTAVTTPKGVTSNSRVLCWCLTHLGLSQWLSLFFYCGFFGQRLLCKCGSFTTFADYVSQFLCFVLINWSIPSTVLLCCVTALEDVAGLRAEVCAPFMVTPLSAGTALPC